MRKFIVTIQKIHEVEVKVNAETPEEARYVVEQMLADGHDATTDAQYSHTLPCHDWPVIQANG